MTLEVSSYEVDAIVGVALVSALDRNWMSWGIIIDVRHQGCIWLMSGVCPQGSRTEAL